MPFMPLVGVIANGTPPQTVTVKGVTVAEGFTVTVTVKLAPSPQSIVVGVTI